MLTRWPIGIGATVVALGLGGVRLFGLLGLIRAGKPDRTRTSHLSRRARREVSEVLGQGRLLAWSLPGLAHAAVFWAFIVLTLTIIEAYGALFSPSFSIPGIGHSAVVGFLEDLFSLAALCGVGAFAVIRLRARTLRPARASRFFGSHVALAWVILSMISAVIVTLLMYRGAQYVTGHFPYRSGAFLSIGIGDALKPLGARTCSHLETVFLDGNVVAIAAFLVIVVYSKHLHIFLAPFNIAFARLPRALGPLASTPNLELDGLGEDDSFGVGTAEQMTWKQALDVMSCTECGRCQAHCPAWATGKPLSPKFVVMDLRDALFDAKRTRKAGDTPAFLVPGVVDPDALWSCTTCGACVEQCPVDIEHVDVIVDMRRFKVLMESDFPAEANTMLRNVESRGDPFGLGSARRLDWTADLDFDVPVVDEVIPDEVEYLFWVGCAGALDQRGQRTTQAIARLLHAAGVSFAVLGPRESCTGDPARRLGNEYLYQQAAKANIEVLNAVRARKIVASCPHCFNTLANEYPALGGNFEVIHHAQLLASLVRDRRLRSTPDSTRVTFHDPCYLGRHNRVFDEPREVLARSSTDVIEMARNKRESFCCGAGGARMWMEESIGTRISAERTGEALATGAEVVSTACPYCKIMLEDAVAARSSEVEVLDIAQLLERAMLSAAPSPNA